MLSIRQKLRRLRRINIERKKNPDAPLCGLQAADAKKELLRIVKNKDGEVSVDLTGKSSGRGAYICPKVECLDKAYKSKALARALDCSIADETYSEMRRVILRRDIER